MSPKGSPASTKQVLLLIPLLASFYIFKSFSTPIKMFEKAQINIPKTSIQGKGCFSLGKGGVENRNYFHLRFLLFIGRDLMNETRPVMIENCLIKCKLTFFSGILPFECFFWDGSTV